jgi:hypothetical protein
MLVLGVPGHGAVGVLHRMLIRLHLMMLVRGRMLRLGTLMHVHGGGRPELVHEA